MRSGYDYVTDKEWSQRDVDLLREIQCIKMEMERHRGKLELLVQTECGSLREEIAGLKGKAKAWGAAAGFVMGFVGFLFQIIKGG